MMRLLLVCTAALSTVLILSCSKTLEPTSLDKSLARQYMDQAITEVQKGKSINAIKLLDRAISADPSYADAHNNKGNVLMTVGRYKEAAISFSRAIDLAGDRVPYMINRGYAYLLLGDKQKALGDFNRVIELNPDNYKVLSFRGQIRMQLSDFEGAIADFNRILVLRPGDGAAYASRGAALAGLDKNKAALDDFRIAETIFRKAGDVDNLTRLSRAKNALKVEK
jgi:tetratricopeptide (TPR) repeat protein